ncbi:MAG: GNAT family N-acetyltransferase [Caldilineaceae bacterium]
MADARPILRTVPEQLLGPRILLRGFTDSDVEPLRKTVEDALPHLQRWLPGFAQPWSTDDAVAFIRQHQARWALRECFQFGIFQHDGSLVGNLRLRPTDWSIPAFDLAYWLHPAAEGHGYVSEAVRLAAKLAFDSLGAQRLVIVCDPKNERSRHIPERLGFIPEGCMRNSARDAKNELMDLLVFALTPQDYATASRSWTLGGDR